MTVEQALALLLKGTGLTARRTGTQTWSVVRAAEPPAAADEYRGNEIVVTAQKRVESVQDVPIAVTALSQKTLEEQKIEGGPDIMRAVPNLTFSKSKFTGYNLTIRGVGTKAERKSVVQGKRGSVRVNHGGRRINKKKQKKQ